MKKKIILFLAIIFLFSNLRPISALVEEERSFTEDFRSKYKIDETDLGANVNTELGEVTAGTGSNGYFGSWQIQSKKVAETWANINKAKLSVEQEIPSQTQIIYYLSNNNGKNWLMVEPGNEYKFSIRGTELKWRAVLVSNNSNLTPKI